MEQQFNLSPFTGIKELELFANFYLFANKEKLYLEKNSISLNAIAKELDKKEISADINKTTKRFLIKLKLNFVLIPSKKSTVIKPLYYVNQNRLENLFDNEKILILFEEVFVERASVYIN